MTCLEVVDITAGYNRLPVVQSVSFAAESGKVTAMIGPNGAGKSTVLKAICGLMPSVTGRVELLGRDVSRFATHTLAKTGIGYVPQENNVFPSLSVLENLQLGAIAVRKKNPSRIREVMAIFPDLESSQRKAAGDLSGGQRNMLAIARALMVTPKALLLDEPTAGLAPKVADVLWTQLHRIAQTGTAILIVEQNVDALLENADWVYVLVAGRVCLSGAPSRISRDELSKLFLGGSATEGSRDGDGVEIRNRPVPRL